jgi:hypothetical protein
MGQDKEDRSMSPVVLRRPVPAGLLSALLFSLALTLALTLVGPPPAAAAVPEVRPISDAERRAVELAVLYLDGGPTAWWPEIASASPLRDMGKEAAVGEIAVRAGPPGGARWLLQTPTPGSPRGLTVFSIAYPSGIEEHLTLLLAEEEGTWKIQAIRSLADPSCTTPAGVSLRSTGRSRWWVLISSIANSSSQRS